MMPPKVERRNIPQMVNPPTELNSALARPHKEVVDRQAHIIGQSGQGTEMGVTVVIL